MATRDLNRFLNDFRIEISHNCDVCHTKYDLSIPLSDKQKMQLSSILSKDAESNFVNVDKALEKLRQEFTSFIRSQYHPALTEIAEKEERRAERDRKVKEVDGDIDKNIGPDMSLVVDTSDPLTKKVNEKYRSEAKDALAKINRRFGVPPKR